MTRKKILIVNDEEDLTEIIRLYLELKDFEVSFATDGISGIEQAKKIQPDLILLDIKMPGMDGYEVCKKLKEDSETKEIPIIFLSSLLNTADKIKGWECGVVDFISSTTDYTELLARVEAHLKIRALTKEIMAYNQELLLKQEALRENLRSAAIIQQSLLPITECLIPNLKVEWFCIPCEWVGGDVCNYIQFNKENIVFYVLDVSGHGVASAMVTVSISQFIQHQNLSLSLPPTPKNVLMALNKEYPFEKFNMFSTLFYMILNPQNGKIVYSCAGHPPPIILRANQQFSLLDYSGAMLGLFDFNYEDKEEFLFPGDKLVLYTDGIIEYRNLQGDLYGRERLYHLLEKIKLKPIKEMVQMIQQDLKDFAGEISARDDISMMIVEFEKKNKLINDSV